MLWCSPRCWFEHEPWPDGYVKTFDVAIIGGGLIGASIAFELAEAKLRVGVFDRQEPGREASWAAAGMLSPAPDSPHDLPLVPLGRESLRLYHDFVAAVEEASGEEARLRWDGTLEIFFGAEAEANRNRRAALCRSLGLNAEAIDSATARLWEPALGPAVRLALWLPEEGTVEPRALTNAVITAARRRGAEIRSNFPVTRFLQRDGRCVGLGSDSEEILANHVILAAGSYCSQIASGSDIAGAYAPTRPVRGQMMALRPDGAGIRRVVRSERGYLVPRQDGRIVAGSTSEDAVFEKRVTPEGMKKIFDAATELVPGLATSDVAETWSGLRPGTPDDLPILGPTEMDGLMIATGHYRNGILLAPVTAKVMRQWIVDGKTEFDASAFSPQRFKHKLSAAV
jgi:glycine oxidase